MKQEDLNDICEIEKECFEKNYSLNTVKKELENKSKQMFKLTLKNKIVGYCLFSKVDDEAELERICVVKKFRKLGLASLLFSTAVKQLKIKTCNLEVNKKNKIAIKLYKKLGFEEVGERKNYYGDGQDALLMAKAF